MNAWKNKTMQKEDQGILKIWLENQIKKAIHLGSPVIFQR